MIIDADAHYTPSPDVFLGHTAIKDWAKRYQHRKADTHSDINSRRGELATLRLDRQLLNPMGNSLEIDYLLPSQQAMVVSNLYNAHMQTICQDGKFDWNIWLPMQDADAAWAELQCYSPNDYFGIFLAEKPQWGFTSRYDRIFAHAHEHGIPLYLHQTHIRDDLAHDEVWRDHADKLQDIFGAKEFWCRTVASFLCSDFFTKFPQARIVVAERDIDWIEDFCCRLNRSGFGDHRRRMSENFWYTTEPESPDFVMHARSIGWQQMLFATDWPHDRDQGGSNSRKDVTTVWDLDIPAWEKRRLFSENYYTLKQRL